MSTGSINPLRRLPDGRYYEDVFLEDLIRYLEDFHMDGFLAGDGWCGLGVMLKDGDFHPDMIDQFETWSGIKRLRVRRRLNRQTLSGMIPGIGLFG